MNLSTSFARILYRHPVKLFLSGLALALVLIPGMRYLEKDYSFRKLSSPNDPKIQNYDLYEKNFGNDDSASVIIYDKKGVFRKETLQLLRDLEAELRQVPSTLRVESLLDGNTVTSTEDTIEITGLINRDRIDTMSQQEMDVAKQKAQDSPQISSYLLSPDNTLTFIYLYLRPTLIGGTNDLYAYSMAVEGVMERFRNRIPDVELLISGSAYLNKTFIEVSKQEQEKLRPAILLIFAIISFIVFRNFIGVFLTLLMIIINVLCTLGVQGYMGHEINGFTSTVGIILTTITTGSIMHVMAGFYRNYNKTGDKWGSLVHSFRSNLVPTFLTSFTTCIGFLSLSDKDLMPVYQMGMIVGVTVMVTWVLLYTMLGPLLAFIHKQKTEPLIGADGLPYVNEPPAKAVTHFAKKFTQFIQAHKNKIIAVWIVAMSSSLMVIPQLEVRMNPFTQFAGDLPIIKTKDLIKEKIGFSVFTELLIDTEQVDGGKKVDFLKRMAAFEDEMLLDKSIIKNISLTSVIKEMNQTFSAGDKTEFRIPDSDEAIAQYLLLYSFSDNGKLKNFISADGRYVKSTVFTSDEDSNRILAKMDKIEQIAHKYGLNLKVTGKLPLFMSLGLVVFNVIGKSGLLSLIAIGFLMTLIVRNLKLGLLAMIPNIIPIILCAGVMRALDYGIDISSTLIFSVCLGIAVDDTIHFMHHWLKQKQEGKTPEAALEHIVVDLFPMIVSTTVILSCGFGVLAFGDFLPNVKFGILAAITLTFAMLADLVLLPSILLKKGFFK